MTVRSLHEYVSHQAERRPEAPAVWSDGQSLSYEELERRSNRLARLLKEGGCRSGDRVGILLPKSPLAVIAMLASLKADCIYVPVDPEGPDVRVRMILNAADCRCLLFSPARARSLLGDEVQGDGPQVVWMERRPECDKLVVARSSDAEAEALPDDPLSAAGRGNAPAHILFTSGSTGTPKGVVVSHANVIAFVGWANAYFGLGHADRTSCHSPLHFDLSTYDLYGSFAAGAQVHLVPPELNLFPARLIDFIRQRRLTQWFSVPSILAYVSRFDAVTPGDAPELKRVLWCGEVFPTPALKYWMDRLTHVRFTNLYGPTEATIASSHYTMPCPPATVDAEIPIGEACGGEEIAVLDERLEQSAPDEIGEIYIGGAGVTLGYWREAEKTAKAFVDIRGRRMYRTGDLGYRSRDGLVRFVGRADTQIKSRGHRIELGEIEAALHAVPQVAAGAVVAIDAPEFGGHVICCAYVPRAEPEAAPAAVKEMLSGIVPKYMVPSRWRRLTTLPFNTNGKVDRPALAEMFRTEVQGRSGSSAGTLA